MPHMQDDFPLLLSTLYDHAVWQYPDQKIVSVEADLTVARSTYATTDARVRKLAAAFDSLGLEVGDAVGTFAWNNQRHHELYWATANSGRVCHTINIRLFADQMAYIINHAQDRVVFVDPNLVPLLAPIADQLETVEKFVIMSDTASDDLAGSVAYEDLIADQTGYSSWPQLDERSPMMYCYSSGTTGNPKGVAYTQRSTYMHTISGLANFPIDATDNVLPVVPMFHAAAWGIPISSCHQGGQTDLSRPRSLTTRRSQADRG